MAEHNKSNTPIAIIGIGCMFARSSELKDYWRLIYRGEDGLSTVPDTHWSPADYFDKDPKCPDHVYCRRGGFIPPVSFDPSEFGIPPANLAATDTSQLLGLVTAKMALKDAGYLTGKDFDRDRASVILGATGTQELAIPLGARLGHPHWRRAMEAADIPADKIDDIVQEIGSAYVPWQENSFPGLLGNVIAGRICNRLDLGGTNCVVDAACASSLSALHLALMELTAHRSDMVITGGVDLLNDIFMHMCFSSTYILSPTEDVRPFSRHADGILLGEGLGMVVLKRLSDAERDGDRIYAVIRALGTSSDGRSQSIYAPRMEGQEKALLTAYDQATVSTDTVALVEGHGTGTRVGDQVEFQTLKKVFGDGNGRPCALGSVKSQIGHTKAAAGSAGLIKAALALHHKVLPPTLKADEPDPKLGIEDSPFYLNHESRPWVAHPDHPRRAGVSSFGFGGSNFHVVLEEYQPRKEEVTWDGTVDILSFSASSHEALVKRLDAFQQTVQDGMTPAAFAAAAHETRTRFSHADPFRLMLAVDKRPFDATKLSGLIKTAADGLANRPPDAPWHRPDISYGAGKPAGDLALLFPGQGSQYLGMGKDFICAFPEALAVLEHADRRFQEMYPTGPWLSDIIYPFETGGDAKKDLHDRILRSTDHAQPAIGAISLAMWRVLQRFKVQPTAVAGHSFGELTALCAADWYPESEFLSLALQRGRCMADAGIGDNCECGTMLAVMGPLEDLERRIRESDTTVVLANKNSPSQGVLSGGTDAITDAETLCRDWGFKTKRLPVSAAFHSPQMATACEPFAAALANVSATPTDLSVYANIDGAPYPEDPAEASIRLRDQLVRPVEFVKTIENMVGAGVRTFLEVGPKSVLTGLCAAISKETDVTAFALDGSGGRRSGTLDLANTLCRIAALGYSVDLAHWEEATEPPRKPKMEITLSGANYQLPKVKKPLKLKKKNEAPERTAPPRQVTVTPPAAPEVKPIPPAPSTRQLPPHEQDTMATVTDSNDSTYIEQALRVAEQGLKSMQALQTRTAEAHQKFLDTQAEASSALKEMLINAQRMTGAIQGAPAPARQTAPAVSQATAVGDIPANPAPEPAPSAPAAQPVTVTAPVSSPTAASDNNGNNAIRDKLLSVVSTLTGYPEEMLALDMDIESDLGIDSIKRVEILSTLEEALPGLPPVQPEVMGRLKTLGQIVSYLTDSADGATAAPMGNAPGEGHAAKSDAPTPPPGAVKIHETLLAIVATLTGYPEEMLDPDMDIESDLGIDSIKRVEILSSLEEAIPGLPQVQPEIMGRLKTLGQIADHLSDAVGTPSHSTEKSVQPTTEPAVPLHGAEGLKSALLAVVSRLTGYPEDMLDSEMDIESDLGIDSIKRVEILSALEEDMPGLPSVQPEAMGRLKTLGQIVEYLSAADAPAGVVTDSPGMRDMKKPAETPPHRDQTDNGGHRVARALVNLVDTPMENREAGALAPDRTLCITDDHTGLSRALADAFAAVSQPAEVLSPAIVQEILSSGKFPENACGLVLLPDGGQVSDDGRGEGDISFLNHHFQLVHLAAPVLLEAGAKGRALLASVARLDGAFGFRGKGIQKPALGGLAGLVKTAALEWERVACRAIDLSPDWSDQAHLASTLAAELAAASPGQAVEVGLGPRTRTTLRLTSKPHAGDGADPIAMASTDVFVVTGGARGVTAASALALAQQAAPTLVLLGRSEAPFPEPEWLTSLTTAGEIKKAIITHDLKGRTPSPRDVEAVYRRYMANREITLNLDKISATGARVAYFQLDVRDRVEVAAALEKIRAQFGPIRGIIHGAGVLEDRLITDKKPEQVARVLDTKIRGLQNLLAATRDDSLAYLVLFSSVAARFGNQGQADYAMANEVLNKIAAMETVNRPQCRTIAINWGPWDGGMVTEALKREFERRHIDLIPLDAGARCLVKEMATADDTPVSEIVIGADLLGDPAATSPDPRVNPPVPLQTKGDLSLLFKREIDVNRLPVLESHRLDGKPVVPFALLTEWIGHSAMHGNPGLYLQGLDDMRLLKGIRLDNQTKVIRMMAGKARKKGAVYEVDVEIRNGVKDGRDVIHSRARAVLSTQIPQAPAADPGLAAQFAPYGKTAREVYDKILFHGNDLQGIKDIIGLSDAGMAARLASAPAPEHWMSDPMRSRWISDPLALDCAFQMACVWCYENLGAVSLPSYSAAYRQFCRAFPENGVTAILEVTEKSSHKMTGNFTFMDADNNVIATLTGYEAVVDTSLFKAFKPQLAVNA